MSYRGGDLDLRTPQSRSGGERGSFEPPLNGPREFEDEYPGDNRSPILVDDTLLACCNHAYDVALAHRAAEVRIEHLLYALTRIDDAAEVLEKHGVRDASLRREAGAFIATEIPLAPSNGASTPRRSKPLEQALRLAAKQGYSRNRPASVSDLLTVFIDVMPELPGLQLLHRHVPRLGGEPSIKSQYQPASETYMPMPQPDMPRRSMRPVYYDDYQMAEPQHYRQPAMPTHTDMVQNSRLAALEQMLSSLRDDTGRFAEDFAGRFVSLENTFSNGARGDDGLALRQTSEKLSVIERSLIDKLDELSRQAAALNQQLEGMEGRLQSANSTGGIDLTPINDRLDQLEALVLERSVTEIDTTAIDGRLNDIETAILSASDSRLTAETVTARIDQLEQAMSGRLSGLHQAQSADRDKVLQETDALKTRFIQDADTLKTSVGAISASVQQRVAAFAQVAQSLDAGRADLARRLESLETMTIRHVQEAAEQREAAGRQLSEVHEAIATLNTNQHTLAGAIDEWRGESVSDMNTIAARLTQLDIDNDAPLARLEQISERMDGMYRATVERYHRRNRFWYWLFGTDDWIGASWPSQTAKVEEDLRAFSANNRSA
ncbi:MAG: hypothetical protein KJ622_10800 [Alphaproteobacteria bacterium]|nr:hypothetical protein [Alphaproteobacteria bacterium]